MNHSKHTVINTSVLKNRKVACLTLDVEQDYGDLLKEPCYEGLGYIPQLVNFFKVKGIPLTCFVQGLLFETHPDKIQKLAELDAEFELHSYSHPGPGKMNAEFEVRRGKETFRKFFGKEPLGYRSPLGLIKEEDFQILAENRFRFDSSIFPSIRPGVFNNLRQPTKPFLVNSCGIVEFPFTVFSPLLRIPVALSYIKLFGRPYFYLLKTFELPNLIIFNFHLHDLFDLDSSRKIPFEKSSFIYASIFRRIYSEKKLNGLQLLEKFSTLLQRKGYVFSKLATVYDNLVSKREVE